MTVSGLDGMKRTDFDKPRFRCAPSRLQLNALPFAPFAYGSNVQIQIQLSERRAPYRNVR